MRGHATHANNAEDRGVADAKQHIQNLRPDQVAAELSGQNPQVDLRGPEEPAQNGSIVGAWTQPRSQSKCACPAGPTASTARFVKLGAAYERRRVPGS